MTPLRLRVAELAMAHRGWTMRLLSEHLDVDHQTVMYWNQGRAFPRLPMMLTICHALGCTLDELVDECPKKPLPATALTSADTQYPLAS
ncbi:MAG: helix-turn-helix domain-containing protein [Vampirovibrionales bacterium]|nr:helix-turn-helix domain-containing protein [Vampirovibrionales bacterium]